MNTNQKIYLYKEKTFGKKMFKCDNPQLRKIKTLVAFSFFED
jgi:hypothetical protein